MDQIIDLSRYPLDRPESPAWQALVEQCRGELLELGMFNLPGFLHETRSKAIAAELGKFAEDLADKPRWLVINKIDLLADDERSKKKQELLEKIAWKDPVFELSAATGEGTESLAQAIVRELEPD